MKKIFILFISLSLFFNGLSQHCNFRNFNLEDGLPQNSVYNIFQDDKGYIWLGTQGGVAIFDGIEFTDYNQIDGIAGNHVTKICQDKYKNIWLGHRYEGFTCINNEKIIKTNPIEGKYNLLATTPWKDGIISIIRTEDSVLNDLYSLKYLTLKNNNIQSINIELDTAFQKNQVKSKDGELFLATNNGLQILNNDLTLKSELF